MHPAVVRRLHPPATVQHAALILLLAWLPTLAYVGHWSDLAAPASTHAASHRSGSAPDGAHEQHCHSGFDSCSGSGALVLAVMVGSDLLRLTSTSRVAFTPSDDPQATGRSDAPVPPPPRD